MVLPKLLSIAQGMQLTIKIAMLDFYYRAATAKLLPDNARKWQFYS